MTPDLANETVGTMSHPLVRRWHRLLPLALVFAAALIAPGIASAATGAISGTITAEGGGGLPDMCVEAFDSAGTGYGASADPSGDYTLGGLATGSYRVSLYPCTTTSTYVGEYYNDKPTFNQADLVSVTDGQTTSGINAALGHGGAITGSVHNQSGDPLAGICVVVDAGGSAETQIDGTYSVTGLRTGSYKVYFSDCHGSTYATQFYNGKLDFDSGDFVDVTAPDTTPNINATLHPGGSIAGTVTEEGSGTPLEHINIALQGPGVNGSTVQTDASGHYVFPKLEPGSYKALFIDASGHHESEYWQNTSNPSSASPITVVAGAETPNIDASLPLDVTAPTTHFTSGPVGATTATSASIGFIANESFVTYECQLDGGGWTACTSPQSYPSLDVGTHTFQVRATDRAGNIEDPPAQGSWTVQSASNTISDTAEPGDTVSSDGGSGPSPGSPVSTAVTTPNPGTVTITDTFATTQTPPSGYALFGREVQITAPDATPEAPLRLVFTVDASAIPAGTNTSTVSVLRNGAPAGECPGAAAASPDPCISGRQTLVGGDLELTVLTSHASYWNLVKTVPVISPPPDETTNPPPSAGPPVPIPPTKRKCKKAKKRAAVAAKKCKRKKRKK
jgi:carboxypeptidase family protein